MTMELTDCVTHVQHALADSQFHAWPRRTHQGLRPRAETKKHGTVFVPPVLDEGIAVDEPGLVMLVKQRVAGEAVANCSAKQMRGRRSGIILDP